MGIDPLPEFRTMIDELSFPLVTTDVDLDARRKAAGVCPNDISFEDDESVPRAIARCDEGSAEAHDAGANDREVVNLVRRRVAIQEIDRALRISLATFSK